MQKVLILGAGMVVNPIVHYLLDKNYYVTVASRTKSKGDAMIGGHKNGRAIGWTIDQKDLLEQMINENDLVVSLLPWVFHLEVASKCIKYKKNMVTTSYVKQPMQALDKQAREAGIIILNEMGLDPGIDHMSAMRIIDHVHALEGEVEEFYSVTGALPAPESADNPFRYKFSWSPKGVVMAGNNDGKYLQQEKVVEVRTENLFKNPFSVDFPEVGKLEIYPNRNSLPYINLYGIEETKTIMRGTFRYPGWCETMDALKALKLITNDTFDFTSKTYADMVAMLTGMQNSNNIKQKAADYLGQSVDSYALNALEWLGIFDDKPMNRQKDTPFEITSDLMINKMTMGCEERDMVAMQHIFKVKKADGSREVIKSSMLDFGTPATDTAVARTVALPAAVGVEMILSGEIREKGVHIPVIPGIYNPVLNKLEEMNIKMKEEFSLPESEMIHESGIKS
ncbi:MAG: saccharopine dehydrogenase C-terminal domain-containing protein [Bacteroidota bacterium]